MFPALPIDERYRITASGEGFLTSEITTLTPDGPTVTVPDVTLRAGLVNLDSVVSIRDISAVAASFGQSVTNRTDGQGRFVDMNDDGNVDIQDISAVASNFGSASPRPWP